VSVLYSIILVAVCLLYTKPTTGTPALSILFPPSSTLAPLRSLSLHDALPISLRLITTFQLRCGAAALCLLVHFCRLQLQPLPTSFVLLPFIFLPPFFFLCPLPHSALCSLWSFMAVLTLQAGLIQSPIILPPSF